jgi:hypothetical protein
MENSGTMTDQPMPKTVNPLRLGDAAPDFVARSTKGEFKLIADAG